MRESTPFSPGGPPERADLRAITLDLDDTIWPVGPCIERAEQVLHDWLLQHAPSTAATFPVERMRALRSEVAVLRPDLSHDLTALRLESNRQALIRSGDDPALAEPAFDLFFAERQRVTYYPEVAAALERLAARWPLLALSNGNAELAATGLDRWFCGSVHARAVGVAKPHARIFEVACDTLKAPARQVLHVGDDWRCDIEGARAAGLHTAWVAREAAGRPEPGGIESAARWPDGWHVRVSHLLELADRLGA